MRLRISLLFCLTVLHIVAAAQWYGLKRSIEARQDETCETGYQACGSTCILDSYTCCPDGLGGCASGSVCQLGDNGQYGCCPAGSVCTGDGGVTGISSTTPTITAPGTTYQAASATVTSAASGYASETAIVSVATTQAVNSVASSGVVVVTTVSSVVTQGGATIFTTVSSFTTITPTPTPTTPAPTLSDILASGSSTTSPGTPSPSASAASSSSSGISTSTIIGAAVGGALGGIAAIAALFFLLKHCRGKFFTRLRSGPGTPDFIDPEVTEDWPTLPPRPAEVPSSDNWPLSSSQNPTTTVLPHGNGMAFSDQGSGHGPPYTSPPDAASSGPGPLHPQPQELQAHGWPPQPFWAGAGASAAHATNVTPSAGSGAQFDFEPRGGHAPVTQSNRPGFGVSEMQQMRWPPQGMFELPVHQRRQWQ